ncbi:hypothetical protein WR25_06293 [Diploscapter pachys]|uniref:NR LBD domain-containing protein n=1 Tax=Diploscapter pachys TaxID=2018661 RepID=A0A2A2JZ62_9BILA|nr:hypothetical protein WR25_06293 [Diploscapter pachys]
MLYSKDSRTSSKPIQQSQVRGGNFPWIYSGAFAIFMRIPSVLSRTFSERSFTPPIDELPSEGKRREWRMQTRPNGPREKNRIGPRQGKSLEMAWACKTFFRRTIVSEQTFICQYNGNCDVNKNIRCACRHCRFNKCLLVGMDAKGVARSANQYAIQNDRDRIGPTKKAKLSSGSDDDQAATPARMADQEIVEQLTQVEGLCQELRTCIMPEVTGVQDALTSPCLLFATTEMKKDPNTIFKELYPASMNDIRMWNIREMRICIEWAKTFEVYQKMNQFDQFALVRNFAFAFNLLNRVFYSQDHGPDKIVFQNGAFIMRQPQQQVQLSGCRPIYTRQMDEIMLPFRRLQLSMPEFATFKAALFFNPDALDLSNQAKPDVYEERNKFLGALFTCITTKLGMVAGVQKYGSLLMMTASIQNILAQNEENMQVMELFKNWEVDPFVKELCMKRA